MNLFETNLLMFSLVKRLVNQTLMIFKKINKIKLKTSIYIYVYKMIEMNKTT